MNKIILIFIAVLVIIASGYFILANKPEIQSDITMPKAEEIETTSLSAIKEITVIGTEFAFNPSELTFVAGEKIKLTFQNQGRAPHNLVIDGLNIGTSVIGGGETETIEFRAPSIGTYNFICSVPGHGPAGMEGVLLVE